MEEIIRQLTDISVRQQQMAEHLISRQDRVEQVLLAFRTSTAQRTPLPDPQTRATQLLPKITENDDVEYFLQMFETTATRERWAPQQFHDWNYRPRLPVRTQAAELHRLAQHSLSAGDPTAAQIIEKVTIDRFLRALPRSHQQAVGMRNPSTLAEMVEAVELADATQKRDGAERAPPYPRRVVPERRTPEGNGRPISRPAVSPNRDEPMPTEGHESHPRAWLAGCTIHQDPPATTPEVHVPACRVNITSTVGSWPVEVGVMKDLPVPVLLGRDWLGLDSLLTSRPARKKGNRRTQKPARRRMPALATADSGRDGESPSQNANLFFEVFQQVSGSSSFAKEQHADDRLKHCWTQVKIIEGQEAQPGPHTLPYFVVQNGLLYCVAQRRGEEKQLLVVPKTKTETVLELAHSHPLAGHLGIHNTTQRIRDRFHWPGLEAEVRRFCEACPTCQKTSPRKPPPSPLIPLPIIEVPFERIGMDLVGPLPKSARGHEHILVIVDYATRYPEAVPLRKAMAKNIAHELFLLFSRVELPSEILTDQGTPFMSRLMADLAHLLKVKQVRTSVYHPQTDGLVERFNQTLKQMLRRVAAEDKKDWDLMLPYVLFGVREVPQASTGFTPFELLFGRQPRGLLDVAREAWERQPAPLRTVVEHVREMRERIERVMPLVKKHLTKAQQAQQRHYNRPAQPREFHPGDRVMVLVPNAACKFLATWQGPYTVTEKIGPVTYRVRQPGRRRAEQLYHINLLKRWVGTREQLAALAQAEPAVVDMNPHLSPVQKTELRHLVGQFSDVFSHLPGQTNILHHEIRTSPGVIVRQRPYRVPEARRQAIEEEVQQMLKLGVIEPSRSPWSSPIVMVPKPDGTLRFCNDFRKLNEVSEFDGYPMPRVDELLDRLGRARFISTLDLTKGYWQVPLAKDAKPKTTFSTPSGHWQYKFLPFGLHGAPATFQRLMDVVLRPHQSYAAAYIDDVVIHSEHWDEHLSHLRRVLTELRRSGLTANPRKCHLALSEAKYLGYQVGRGLIKPQPKKVEAVHAAPRPSTKTQVRAFLGLAGYYRCFIPNFSSIASPLTDLTRKGQPEKIEWSPEAERAFQRVKKALTSEPVLRAPDFTRPFLVQTDASDTGLGAVLSQVTDGQEHPVIYISRKLTKPERNYVAVEKEALAVK
ncbi:Retrovirus-related Pol polyprotein from transposon 17.6 [Labeo rohita]|uniref:Gypsy retrotransposon integrase-like protein 1 n=1 Tax=Labeo rohita TaxID=84645 RepID=A0ABQ8L974_LABRO|nr:Retrovirus-related Pol polyprotein from transposon 17.6 [Labeo rohita]